MMGSPESDEDRRDDERQHYVEVAAFKMLKTPVTFAMYDAYCNTTDRDKPKYYREDIANHPVTNVEIKQG